MSQAGSRPTNDGLAWTREQTILAFDLYCRIPFQQTKATNPRVRELAALLERTPASVARKLGNFGAFDPELARRNVVGLTHGSKLDRQVWDDFHDGWSSLVSEASEIRGRLAGVSSELLEPTTRPEGTSERLVTAVQRLHQAFFRESVLSSYDFRCCITGLPIRECLVAGHIVPWSVDERRRADPTNGICLSATFDRLFDRGLITLDTDLQIVIAAGVRGIRDASVQRELIDRAGSRILLPGRFAPSQECLEWHRQNVFRAS